MTNGFTGADLEALVREAVMLALREKLEAREVSMKYFLEALKVVKPSLSEDVMEKYQNIEKTLRSLFI
jgi:transitional endoplasmic reticulum ATPase